MAVKYHCRKCGKRYVEWGAQKLGFKCPDCSEELVRAGVGTERPVRKPALRRQPVRESLGSPFEEGMMDEFDEVEGIAEHAGLEDVIVPDDEDGADALPVEAADALTGTDSLIEAADDLDFVAGNGIFDGDLPDAAKEADNWGE